MRKGRVQFRGNIGTTQERLSEESETISSFPRGREGRELDKIGNSGGLEDKIQCVEDTVKMKITK